MSFDALEFSAELIESGFTEQQARALAHGIWKLSDAQLASKADLAAFKSELKAEIQRLDLRIDELKAYLEQRILESEARVKAELLKIIMAAVVVQSGIVAALFKWLH